MAKAKTPQNAVKAKGAGTKAEAKGPEKVGPVKFVQQTRQEANKVTWTSWPETWKTTILVMIMVVLSGMFFFVVDGALSFLVTFFLGLGTEAPSTGLGL